MNISLLLLGVVGIGLLVIAAVIVGVAGWLLVSQHRSTK
jgi:hypothetical protein